MCKNNFLLRDIRFQSVFVFDLAFLSKSSTKSFRQIRILNFISVRKPDILTKIRLKPGFLDQYPILPHKIIKNPDPRQRYRFPERVGIVVIQISDIRPLDTHVRILYNIRQIHISNFISIRKPDILTKIRLKP